MSAVAPQGTGALQSGSLMPAQNIALDVANPPFMKPPKRAGSRLAPARDTAAEACSSQSHRAAGTGVIMSLQKADMSVQPPWVLPGMRRAAASASTTCRVVMPAPAMAGICGTMPPPCSTEALQPGVVRVRAQGSQQRAEDPGYVDAATTLLHAAA